jgi:hypothetical protein
MYELSQLSRSLLIFLQLQLKDIFFSDLEEEKSVFQFSVKLSQTT